LVLILSEDSIQSGYGRDEVERGQKEEESRGAKTVLFPIFIDQPALDVDHGWVKWLRNDRYFGDFTGWKDPAVYDEHLKQVIGWLEPAGDAASRTT
jgi:hypothetical protein